MLFRSPSESDYLRISFSLPLYTSACIPFMKSESLLPYLLFFQVAFAYMEVIADATLFWPTLYQVSANNATKFVFPFATAKRLTNVNIRQPVPSCRILFITYHSILDIFQNIYASYVSLPPLGLFKRHCLFQKFRLNYNIRIRRRLIPLLGSLRS